MTSVLIWHKLLDHTGEGQLRRGREALDDRSSDQHIDRSRLRRYNRSNYTEQLSSDEKVSSANDIAEASDEKQADSSNQ